MLGKAVLTVYLFSLGVLQLLFIINTALHNCSSSDYLLFTRWTDNYEYPLNLQ